MNSKYVYATYFKCAHSIYSLTTILNLISTKMSIEDSKAYLASAIEAYAHDSDISRDMNDCKPFREEVYFRWDDLMPNCIFVKPIL